MRGGHPGGQMHRPHCRARRLIRGRKNHRGLEGHRDQALARRLVLRRRRVHLDSVRRDRDRDLAFDREPGGLVEAALSPGWVEVRLVRRGPCRCST